MENNKKKSIRLKHFIICAILLVLICALLLIVLSNQNTKDITPPSITFSSNTIVFDPDENLSKLLRDVKATDEEDGDVTASLRVRTVNISDDNKSAVVTYVAKDKSNNIGLEKRIVKIKKKENTDVFSEEEETP